MQPKQETVPTVQLSVWALLRADGLCMFSMAEQSLKAAAKFVLL